MATRRRNSLGTLSPQYVGNQNGTSIPGLQGGNSYPLAPPPAAAPTGNRARSDAALRAARLALAVTDVHLANEKVAAARREQIRYAPNEDSPDRVDAAIARFVEVSRMDRSSEDNRKIYARMLMEQSEALLQWGELEQADKLAALAVEQRVRLWPLRGPARRASAADSRHAAAEQSGRTPPD